MTLFKLSVSLGCVMRQFNAKRAFEHSTIRKEVFLSQPQELVKQEQDGEELMGQLKIQFLIWSKAVNY